MQKDDIIVFIIKEMIKERMSIREMAIRINMPKSTLHKKIQYAKRYLDEETKKKFNDLLIFNKQDMSRKGGYAKNKKLLEYKNNLKNENLKVNER